MKAKQQQLDDAEERARLFQEEAEVLKRRLDEVLSKPGMGILKSSSRMGSRAGTPAGSDIGDTSPRGYPTTASATQKSIARSSPIPFLRIFGSSGKDPGPPLPSASSSGKQVAFNSAGDLRFPARAN